MNKVNAFRLFAIAATLLAVTAGWAAADITQEPILGYHGHAYVDIVTGDVTWDNSVPSPLVGTDVYSNVTSPPNFGFSSTDLASTWGDRVTTTGTGILAENDFTIFNSGSSAGPLLTFQCAINFYDGTSLASLGGYATPVINFGAGLSPGFFSIITITGLGGAGINLNTTDVIVTQQVIAKTGPASRLGIASLDPPTIGSSANTMYINSGTIGPAGFYNIGNPPLNANPGYRINVNTPVPTKAGTWGSIKADYR